MAADKKKIRRNAGHFARTVQVHCITLKLGQNQIEFTKEEAKDVMQQFAWLLGYTVKEKVGG